MGTIRAGASLFLLLSLTVACAAPTTGARTPTTSFGTQGIRGTLTFEGRALSEAYVYAYRRSGTNLLGPADFSSDPSGADGSYRIGLVRGSYWIVARKRASGENTGPLAMGDLYGFSAGNPVSVAEGAFTEVDIELEELRDPMFFQARSRRESGQGVRGVIVDGDGRPVPWAFAMAYTSADMKRAPEYTSVMTKADGEFVVYLPRGGKFWLAARKHIRERPVEGEPFGIYRGSPDRSLDVPEGEFLEGIVIELERYRKGMLE